MAVDFKSSEKAGLSQQVAVNYYCCNTGSILIFCICVWYLASTAVDRKALKWIVTREHRRSLGCSPPQPWEDFYNTCCLSKVTSIALDPTHPRHSLFEILLSGRHYRSVHGPQARRQLYPKCH